MRVQRTVSLFCMAMVVSALLVARPLAGQARPWAAGLELGYNLFAGGVTNFEDSRVLPTDRFGFTALGIRNIGDWVLRLEVGFAHGHILGSDSASTIELTQLETSMPRYRIEPLVGRSIARIGAGGLLIYLGATMDLWRLDSETRFTLGGEARLALQAPLGRLVLENYIGFGIAPQPFPPEELTPDITTHPLTTVGLGLSLRYCF